MSRIARDRLLTIIDIYDDEDTAYIYTNSKHTYSKLKRNSFSKIERIHRAKGKEVGWVFELPKDMVLFIDKNQNKKDVYDG